MKHKQKQNKKQKTKNKKQREREREGNLTEKQITYIDTEEIVCTICVWHGYTTNNLH